MRQTISCIILLWLQGSLLFSQEFGIVKGFVSDEAGDPLPGATILNLSTGKGAVANTNGNYQLQIQPGRQILIEFSFIGFRKDTIQVTAVAGETVVINHTLKAMPGMVGEVVVESWYDRAEALQQINIRSLDHVPLPSGNIETLLTTLGASSRNEMSSQYSVRGGNFDENLIYVNDIEVYKPMLVKAGQQEGLSFVNSAMVSSIQFAAGGFDARYGDKMSSVLDIRYRRPTEFAASTSISLLGGSLHAEGSGLKGRFTHITGARYKSNQYLLGTLQTDADYQPHFFDLQTFLTYDLSDKLEISFLGNLARNTYNVIPQSRETAFGTYQQTMNFTVYYEGQEKDRFTTMLGALSLDYHPSEFVSLKLIGSGFTTSESITYDILGQYRIDLLDNTPGSETAGDSILNLGIGSNLIHARNYLDANIYSVNHKGSYRKGRSNLNWGLGLQSEDFRDKIREWEMVDSAGYTIPYSDNTLEMLNTTVASNHLKAFRLNGYIHNISGFYAGASEILVNAGLRFNYLNTNGQLVVSPRVSVHLIPAWQHTVAFHASLGWYHQPPFYKEMRDPEGTLYPDVRAQQSVHILAGTTWDFQLWERPFRFTTELYYKKLDHLIPYTVDDVEIQYLPQYLAKGYATGIEFKINGEFVKDAESWATLSFLRTYENRAGDPYGSYPRPTDQLVNFGLYFQDYFPTNPSYRVHLNFYYGSRLPYNSTNYDNPEEYYYLKAYQRIDIGLSKSLVIDRDGNRRTLHRFIKDLSFGVEVFNLFDFKNQASYQWVRTVSNQQGFPNMFAVPNYLTGRLLNVRISLKV